MFYVDIKVLKKISDKDWASNSVIFDEIKVLVEVNRDEKVPFKVEVEVNFVKIRDFISIVNLIDFLG